MSLFHFLLSLQLERESFEGRVGIWTYCGSYVNGLFQSTTPEFLGFELQNYTVEKNPDYGETRLEIGKNSVVDSLTIAVWDDPYTTINNNTSCVVSNGGRVNTCTCYGNLNVNNSSIGNLTLGRRSTVFLNSGAHVGTLIVNSGSEVNIRSTAVVDNLIDNGGTITRHDY